MTPPKSEWYDSHMREYERKFIVPAACYDAIPGTRKYVQCEIEDAYYLSASGVLLRVRAIDRKGADRRIELAIKLGEGIDRREFKFVCSQDPQVRSAPLGRIAKERREWSEIQGTCYHIERIRFAKNLIQRYSIPRALPIGDPSAPAIEKFVAEIEGNPSIVDAFKAPPDWHEVTGKSAYSNLSLATYGWPGDPVG